MRHSLPGSQAPRSWRLRGASRVPDPHTCAIRCANGHPRDIKVFQAKDVDAEVVGGSAFAMKAILISEILPDGLFK
jgi:hypothetical protein